MPSTGLDSAIVQAAIGKAARAKSSARMANLQIIGAMKR
jgi:hypothetical protein